MEGEGRRWREIIQDKLKDLADCTVVTSEMATRLSESSLIYGSEKHDLMNTSTSDHERALILYEKVARKWNDEDFGKFKLILAECLNKRALEILNSTHTRQIISIGSKDSEPDSGPNNNGDFETTSMKKRKTGTRTQDLQLRDQMKSHVEDVRVECNARMKQLEKSLRAVITSKVNQATGILRTDLMGKVDKQGLILRTEISSTISQEVALQNANFRKEIDHLTNKTKAQDTKIMELEALLKDKRSLRAEQDIETCRILTQQTSSPSSYVPVQKNRIINKQTVSDEQTHTYSDTKRNLKQVRRHEDDSGGNDQFQLKQINQAKLSEQINIRHSTSTQSPEGIQIALPTVEAYSATENETWQANSTKIFETEKVAGKWHVIERFDRDSAFETDWNSVEYDFNLTGNTVEQTRRGQKLNSNETKIENYNYTVDSQCPHFWRDPKGYYGRVWDKTEYKSWAILAICNNPEVSSSRTMYILSRTREMPLDVLEMLRNFCRSIWIPKRTRIS